RIAGVYTGGAITDMDGDGRWGDGSITDAHALGTFNAANGNLPVQLFPFSDTPNPGGEYKAWLIQHTDLDGNLVATTSIDSNDPRVIHFSDKHAKTDNCKVRLPQWGGIGGIKYEDVRGDDTAATIGADDDRGLGGVQIDLIDSSSDEVVTTTRTRGDGSYYFDNVAPGTYTVREHVPDGWIPTADADAGKLGEVEVTVTAGQDVTGVNFANFELFDISGKKFTDANGDGQTAGDSGLGGVTIFIDMDNSGDFNAGDLSTTTAADGTWAFSGLDYTYAGKQVYEGVPPATHTPSAPPATRSVAPPAPTTP